MELENSLRQRLSGRPCKTLTMTMATEAMADETVLDILLRFMYRGEDPLRWRAAWVLEKVSASCPPLLSGEREEIRRYAMQLDIPSGVCRLLLAILHHLPDEDSLDVEFLNFLLDRMCDLRSPAGVQALAMKLAYRMTLLHPDLHQEFLCIVSNLELDYYSAGLRSVVRHCLKRG